MVESQMSHVVNAIHLSFSEGSFQKKKKKKIPDQLIYL